MKSSNHSSTAHPATNSPRQDLYRRVTDSIIASLERGVRPWLRPWNAQYAGERLTTLPLRHNGVPYRGINILLLWGALVDKGYTRNTWMTFRQALELGAHIRKGEHGSMVVYADRITRNETNERGEDVAQEIPFLKAYTVFNVEQIEGLPTKYSEPTASPAEPMNLIERAEAFFAATGATFHHGGNQAFYASVADLIQLPPPEAFRDAQSYAATKAHELVHWTRHPSRLDRSFGRKHFGDEGYAREELVAEMGVAFLCAALEIALEPREDHAGYIASWLEVLKHDKRAVFQAASYAQLANDYLFGLQPTPGANEVAA
jgi:antirestriction protein ArdC